MYPLISNWVGSRFREGKHIERFGQDLNTYVCFDLNVGRL